MKKKVIALLLAASIVSTAFSGCADEQDASAETETAENKNTEGVSAGHNQRPCLAQKKNLQNRKLWKWRTHM